MICFVAFNSDIDGAAAAAGTRTAFSLLAGEKVKRPIALHTSLAREQGRD